MKIVFTPLISKREEYIMTLTTKPVSKSKNSTPSLKYLKKHYEQICKLCAIGKIPYLPSIKLYHIDREQLAPQIIALEEALHHIKRQIRKILSHNTTSDKKTLISQLMYHSELCESLSNYRRDLESLFFSLNNS